jgi:uncharacterized protein YndB with AHSA1/START domain
VPGPNGRLEERDGRPALRFERVLRHAPEQVWRALTDPTEQSAWHPTPARFELAVGGRVTYLEGGYVAGMADGEVTACEPPRLLAYTWPTSDPPKQLRWELAPHEGGCLLTLVQSFDDRNVAVDYSAGWHICLDALAERLDGGRADGERPTADRHDLAPYLELKALYERLYRRGKRLASLRSRA